MNEIVEKIKSQILPYGFEYNDKESTRDLLRFKRNDYEICLYIFGLAHNTKPNPVIQVELNSYVNFEYQGKNYRKKLSTKCDMPFSGAGDWGDIIYLINHPVEIDEKDIWNEIQQYNFENILGQNIENIENSFENKNFKFSDLLEHKEKIIFKKEFSVFKMLDTSILSEKAKKINNNKFDILDSFTSYTYNEFDIVKCSYGFHEGNISEYYALNPGDNKKISKDRFDKNEQYKYFWDYFEKFDELKLKPLNRKAWSNLDNLSKQIQEYQQEHSKNKLLDGCEFKVRYITESGEYFVDSFSNQKRSVINRFVLPLENSFEIFKEKFDNFMDKSLFSAKDFVDKIPSDEFELLSDKNYYVINNSKDGILISDDNYCVPVIFKPKDYDNLDIEKMKEIIIAEFVKENDAEIIKYSPMFGREIDIKKYFADKKDKQNSIQETLLKFG